MVEVCVVEVCVVEVCVVEDDPVGRTKGSRAVAMIRLSGRPA